MYLANTVENRARVYYYPPPYYRGGSWYYAVPWLHLDGDCHPGYNPSGWETWVQNKAGISSPMTISLSGSYNPGNRIGTINARLTNTGSSTINGTVQFVITETGIYAPGPNGETIHNQVMRKMLPDANGENITIPVGGFIDRSRNFTVNTEWNKDSCQIVVFVQKDSLLPDSTKLIYQGGKINVRDLSIVGVEKEKIGVETPVVLSLAQANPNPFSTKTTIEYNVPGNLDISIKVYNLLGEMVKVIVDGKHNAGTYRVDWNGRTDSGERVSEGVYFYRLESGRESITRRVIVLK